MITPNDEVRTAVVLAHQRVFFLFMRPIALFPAYQRELEYQIAPILLEQCPSIAILSARAHQDPRVHRGHV